MRLTEAKLKEIIRQEVEYRLIESAIDDLIVEELKKMGINEGVEDDWKKKKKQLTRRKVLQFLVAAGAIGLGGAWVDSYIKADATERREMNSQWYDAVEAQKSAQKHAKGSSGAYEGPDFGDQGDYFSNLDFAGSIQDIKSLPEDSIGGQLSQFKVSGLPDLYISAEALLDKPIPKMKANSGKDALMFYQIKYQSANNKQQALMRLYKELVGIGQVGYSGIDVAMVVNDGGRPVRVLPPEWSILFHFITQEAANLSESDLTDFQNQIYDTELYRFYNTVGKGKQVALDSGYDLGSRALKSGRPDITAEQYRQAYPDDLAAHQGKHFFDIGFVAGTAGEEKPKVPR